jgi:hypothetical protein
MQAQFESNDTSILDSQIAMPLKRKKFEPTFVRLRKFGPRLPSLKNYTFVNSEIRFSSTSTRLPVKNVNPR